MSRKRQKSQGEGGSQVKKAREAEPFTKVSILGQENIFVGYDLLKFIPGDLKANVPAAKYALVTDDNVAKIFLHEIQAAFKEVGIELLVKTIPPGESSKNRATKEDIENWMLSHHCNRDTCVIALGGGVLGDLVGFVAATFLRGIPVIQMPTSLLAMVDSSIGGKTGLDTQHGKNLIGAFHQPKRIYINLSFLKSLPERQLFNGMAEVIKTAVIWNEEKFKFLEDNVEGILAGDEEAVRQAVLGSVEVKARVVTEDEREGGLREILNFGHSIGHAIEALMQPGMLHGEAVSIGMIKEGELARNLGHLSQADLGRLTRCLQAYHLPVGMPKGLDLDDLMEKMAVDKKNKGGKKGVIILSGIGRLVQRRSMMIEDEPIMKILSPALEVIPCQKQINTSLRVPGSKSISNRALLLAALGKGNCKITGLLHSDDTQVMIESLQQLGVKHFKWSDRGSTLTITGSQGIFTTPKDPLYLGNAGTAARFLASVCTIVKGDGYTIITGNKRMKERPIGPLVEALRANGCEVDFLEKSGCLPLKVKNDCLSGGSIELSAKISSQYVSSVLIASPYATQPTELKIIGKEIVSEPYIDMTIGMMATFGVEVKNDRENRIYSIPQRVYTNPKTYSVEADASSATYPLAIAAITGGKVSVKGIGTGSLQGDANFYKLLERMGCTVSQNPDMTTVTGPEKGTLKPIDVDMGDMTDAFMTAAVLMAVANGTSTITNIANQRVKESNRIAVMVEELGKCGVHASELPDGIKIQGTDFKTLRGANISCHDDHRIAMSFAVFGCLVEGVVITDKACVEKTYPEFWDDLERVLSVAVKVPKKERFNPALGEGLKKVEEGKTIVIIGMRGAGKTHLGTAAAKQLGREFVDLDHYFEKALQVPIMQFVEKEGWPSFRAKEVAHLLEILKQHPTGAIVACGGGIVETPEGREALKKHALVVEVRRDIDDVVNYLNSDKSRPYLGEPPQDVYKRRKPWYDDCSNYEFVIRRGDEDWKATEKDFIKFISIIIGQTQSKKWIPLDGLIPKHFENSFFLSLTFPNLKEALPLLSEISEGADALEIRVDLFESQDPNFIREQVALLRRHSSLPLIYTVRSLGQGGKFPEDEEKIFSLLRLGLRLGCEYIDMETSWSVKSRNELLDKKGHSKIIASFHDPKGAISWDEFKQIFQEVSHKGRADIVKLIGMAKEISDSFKIGEVARASGVEAPTIAICMGEKGKLSRVLNAFMTPVTHPKLPLKAAPGQLSITGINRLRAEIGLIPSANFYLFGHPISQSMSPTLHNKGFETLALPFKYHLSESKDISHVAEVLKEDTFGGASVTIPHKEAVLPLLDSVSAAAKAIGAVNTILKVDGKLFGDNTDWLGIRQAILCKQTRNIETALILGAGGTARAACHTLREMGIKRVLIFNRSPGRAQLLAREFGAEVCPKLEELKQLPLDLIIGTIPSQAQGEENVPQSLFDGAPLVVELAYRPRVTRLLRLAKEANCQVVEGIDILIEQGYCQFKIWTSCEPPKEVMRETVLRVYGASEPSSS